MNRRWYFAFFLVSGFCSLVYEVVWLRLAMAKFGVTTPLVSIVLSTFMAGLAIGSMAGGAIARRLSSRSPAGPLRLYGIVELLIGLSGLLVPRMIQFGYELTQKAGGRLAWDSSSYYVISGGWIVVSLLPWCMAMGATFPLAMAAIQRIPSRERNRSFSYLYLANVLGAILGTLISALVLIELWGFQATLQLASTLNILLATTVFALSLTPASYNQEAASRQEITASRPGRAGFSPRGTLALLFLTGLCTMAMEVVWIRQFAVYLGNVVYAFAVILAVYLAATWLGSFIYRQWVRTHQAHESAGAWAILGLLALLPFPFTDPALPVQTSFLWGAFRTAAGIGPFSAVLGFLTPLLVDDFSGGQPGRAGQAYAVNIVGGIAGPLLSGFLILPWFGERWGLAALSMPLFSVGLPAVARKQADRQSLPSEFGSKSIFALGLLLGALLVFMTKDYEASYTEKVELRDYMATVVAAKRNGSKFLLVNGNGMTALTPITKYMAHLPLAFLDRPPRKGLVICFGMGTTFRSMLSWGFDTTVVELVPSVPKLFSYFHQDAAEVTKSPLAHIVIDDGRRYLERSADLYDVISMDPPPPLWTPTTSLLYSREFYALVKKHLQPGGIFQAWQAIIDPGWDLSMQTAFAKAIRDSFPYVRVFPSLGGWGFHMLASDRPIPAWDASYLASRMPARAVADLVEWTPGHTAAEMLQAILQTEQQISRLASIRPAVGPIQDDRPINEYFFWRRMTGPYP